MEIVWTLISSPVVILISIELSSAFDCLPNGEPIPGSSHLNPVSPPAASSGKNSSEKSPSTDRSHRSAESSNPAEPPVRARTRSPPARTTVSRILGFTLEDLKVIRLIPSNYSTPIFEFRRYVFPPDKPIRLRDLAKNLLPMPTHEIIVLSTSNGDVCAVWERSMSECNYLRAIYTPVHPGSKRAKININSGVVQILTPEEIARCPVGTKRRIKKSFKILHVEKINPQ